MRLIFKFGGSSLSNVQKIKGVAKFIKETKARDKLDLIVVVSAMGNTTNRLIGLAKQISVCPCTKAYSSLITSGEIISASLLTMALEELEVKAVCLSAKDIKVHAKGDPKCAVITHIDTKRIEDELSAGKVVVVTGFQGVDDKGDTVALGRGGSDTTAIALGTVFNAKVKIFTDVDGFYTADPNKIANSKKLDTIDVIPAIELASAGAKVLDARCLELANIYKTNIEVLKSNENSGTKVTFNNLENYHINGITFQNNLRIVKNTSKNTDKLQIIFQNTNFYTKIYNIERVGNVTRQIIVTDASRNQVLNICKQKNNNNLQVNECEIVVLVGSGLIFYKEFMQKVQNLLKINKIYTFLLNLNETCLKLVVKKHQAFKLTNLLVQEFGIVDKE